MERRVHHVSIPRLLPQHTSDIHVHTHTKVSNRTIHSLNVEYHSTNVATMKRLRPSP